MCKSYITQIKDLRLRLEGCESRTVNRLRQLVDKEPLKACAQRATEQKVCRSTALNIHYISLNLMSLNLLFLDEEITLKCILNEEPAHVDFSH